MENNILNTKFKDSKDERIIGNVFAITENLQERIKELSDEKLNKYISYKIKEILFSVLIFLKDKEKRK